MPLSLSRRSRSVGATVHYAHTGAETCAYKVLLNKERCIPLPHQSPIIDEPPVVYARNSSNDVTAEIRGRAGDAFGACASRKGGGVKI